ERPSWFVQIEVRQKLVQQGPLFLDDLGGICHLRRTVHPTIPLDPASGQCDASETRGISNARRRGVEQTMRRIQGTKLGALLVSGVVLSACGESALDAGTDDGNLGESSASLQLTYINQNYVNLITSTNSKTQSTGAIRFIWLNGLTPNCGATFISPH